MSFFPSNLHINGGLNGDTDYSQKQQDGNSLETHPGLNGTTNGKLVESQQELLINNNAALHGAVENGAGDTEVEEAPTIDILINNVVCTFSTKCHLNLKKIAMEGVHVEYKRQNGMLNMKLRRPHSTATIWSSGKITCTGATSEEEAKLAARRIARRLQRLGFNARFSNFRVVNVLGTCAFPFGIKLNPFSATYKEHSSYEPELHPGVTYKIKEPRATLKIFSTGSITVTAPSVLNVQLAIEHIYPLVNQFKMETSQIERKILLAEKKYMKKGGVLVPNSLLKFYDDEEEDEEEEFFDEDELDEDHESDLSDFDSDVSHD